MKLKVTKEQWNQFVKERNALVQFLKENNLKGWPETYREGSNHYLHFRGV